MEQGGTLLNVFGKGETIRGLSAGGTIKKGDEKGESYGPSADCVGTSNVKTTSGRGGGASNIMAQKGRS